jgi:hypothetical protein
MPFLARITNTFFVDLINRLGVRPPPPEGFELSNVVQPVSIVDSSVAITVSASPVLYNAPVSAGSLAAPAINTVLADTGNLAAGAHNYKVIISVHEEVTLDTIALQHRDAADAANIWEQQIFLDPSFQHASYFEIEGADTFQLNESLRVILITASGAGSTFHANIWTVPR